MVLEQGCETNELPFDFTAIVSTLIQLLNKKSKEYFKQRKEKESIPYIIQAVDILMHKSIHKYIKPI